jgi:hypothetical protein
MRVLVLIISNDLFPVYAHHRAVWASYMKAHPNVDCYFITASPLVFVPTLSQTTITVRGIERYGRIFAKTIDALAFALARRDYSYVVRTNLSSVWDFKQLFAYLDTAPRERLYAGQVIPHRSGFPFASGAGILMSVDVARTLVATQHLGRTLAEHDDVAIAGVLAASGLTPQSLPRVDFVSLAHYEAHGDKIPPGSFHYRVKHENHGGDRMEEPMIMRRLLQEHIYAP